MWVAGIESIVLIPGEERISVAGKDFGSLGGDEGHAVPCVNGSCVVVVAHSDLRLSRQMAKRHIVKDDAPNIM